MATPPNQNETGLNLVRPVQNLLCGMAHNNLGF